MGAIDVVPSPWMWIVLAVCILGGWFAKRDLFVFAGAVVGVLAPLILVPTWFASLLGLLLPFHFLRWLAPGLVERGVQAFAALPDAARHALHPATILTAVLFVVFCRLERASSGLPMTHAPRHSQPNDANPFSRRLRQ